VVSVEIIKHNHEVGIFARNRSYLLDKHGDRLVEGK
jgi:hypothetical protein